MGAYYWSPGMTIKGVEEQFAADAMHFYQNNRQSAANSLGLTLAQLDAIIKRSQLGAEEQARQDKIHKDKAADFLARSRGIIGVDAKTGHETLSPYVKAEGFEAPEAAAALANSTGMVTPENVIPAAAVLANAGDPVAAAKRTKALMDEALKSKAEEPIVVVPEPPAVVEPPVIVVPEPVTVPAKSVQNFSQE